MASEEDAGGRGDQAPPGTRTAHHTHVQKWAAASLGLLSGGARHGSVLISLTGKKPDGF